MTTEWITHAKLRHMHQFGIATDATARLMFMQLQEAGREKVQKIPHWIREPC